MSNPDKDWKNVKPLLKEMITCTSSRCELGMHSFRRDMRKKINQNKTFRNGVCAYCGANLIGS